MTQESTHHDNNNIEIGKRSIIMMRLINSWIHQKFPRKMKMAEMRSKGNNSQYFS